MSSHTPSSIETEFAERCGREHAQVCGDTRPPGLLRRLWLWRDERLVRQALKVAGEPGLVLDLACGSGRFWPVLAEHGNRVILASDNSQAMLDHAQTHHGAVLLRRVKTFQGSAFNIGLSANAVDCIFCLELFRHVPGAEARLALLREFHRVSRDTVIVSVNSDSRHRAAQGPSPGLSQEVGLPPVIHRAEVEAEFKQAGFKILNQQEFMPGSALWRVYVLRKRG
ncbi:MULTISPECIES: class I SAM-dependent methyltransferase [unclassified Pseudomonas]|uniref:class I SAM-dependent methyltransferase n=1 Tax=unclassified Pseudomonas TaxID=196821 RepID=UPI0011ED3311|nr:MULTISPECIES: class I SAM-dependent methyltransferase [unclassified Pseudomonas]KAA0943707.1 class I SAM-dependent methyltransferase [Pseudomonas sp. ANT_H4]KAA0950150.1 class I SAM-dependent methyltransferase [Pseudomonas sp. ANT_H14]